MARAMTDEQVIQKVNEYLTRFPNAKRNTMLKYGGVGSAERLKKLEAEGKITLPKATAMHERNNSWRNYITKKIPPTKVINT
jgi:predicted PolB exonuclease-like 3'-5' exonuclease